MADLVLFNKVNKDRSAASSYRPICLLTAWSKMLDRLVFHARSQGFLHRNQFGFTPCLGTENALHELRTIVEGCHNRDSDCCPVMLDVKGAFNNLWLLSILEALGRMRCPGNLFKLVKSFLSEWKVLYRTDITTLVHEYNVGCPQGSNYEPFFWNLVANSPLELAGCGTVCEINSLCGCFCASD